jgi:hypothetical protein
VIPSRPFPILTIKQIGELGSSRNQDEGLCLLSVSSQDYSRLSRLAVIYRVVNMLIYFEPADMCELQNEFTIAPLPAKKQLWEAGDERTWAKVTTRGRGDHEHLALSSRGELVRLDEGGLWCHNGVMRYRISSDLHSASKTTVWEEWCSGMDGFGSLIMLAASLVV